MSARRTQTEVTGWQYFDLTDRKQFLASHVAHFAKYCGFLTLANLTLYVPCIVTNSTNRPTRCSFLYVLILQYFCTTLHVSNDHFVYHQEFMIYCILQLGTNRANVPDCSVLRLVPTVRPSSRARLHGLYRAAEYSKFMN